MANRKALIIGAPDNKIPGVNADIENLKSYFKSPVGGSWYDYEIKTLVSPTVNAVKKEMELLKLSDYSLIFFAGHGYHSIERKRTILHINSMETLDSLELRVGSLKHSLILDCCRKPESERRLLRKAFESMTFDSGNAQTLNPLECRKYFDSAVAACDSGIVVMNSCSIGETAGESESEGGYYTSSLIDLSNEWAKKRLESIDLARSFEVRSTQDCHNSAASQVNLLSGGRQHPTFESPRSKKIFPFAIVA